MALKEVLTIADSDTSVGVGTQTDLKTFQELNIYGVVALATIIIMDKETWSHNVTPLPMSVFEKQLETVISIDPNVVKTGMPGIEEIIKHTGEVFEQLGAKYFTVDLVMVCKGEDEVPNPGNIDTMIKYLLFKVTVVTPNLFEAGQLSGLGKLTSAEDMKGTTEIICDQDAQHIIIKGSKALDQGKSYGLYYGGQAYYQLTIDMFQQSYNHGAGCTFATAITAYLINGESPKEAVISAKAFVASAVKNGRKMNDFVGPVDHGAYDRVERIDVDVKEV